MSGCELLGVVTPLQILEAVWNDLFPHARKSGIQTASYLTLILNHSRVTNEEKEFSYGLFGINLENIIERGTDGDHP